MRYVNPAHSLAEQNLVACQNNSDIYFYTIRPVEPNQELLVWYSHEFSQRLCSQQGDIKPSEYSTKTHCQHWELICSSLSLEMTSWLNDVWSIDISWMFPTPQQNLGCNYLIHDPAGPNFISVKLVIFLKPGLF